MEPRFQAVERPWERRCTESLSPPSFIFLTFPNLHDTKVAFKLQFSLKFETPIGTSKG